MYIENIKIKTFGKLENVDITLSEGVNIIEGANESGKSTLAAFIKFIFYGIPTKERAAAASWRTGSAEGSLSVNTGEHRYRIERSMLPAGGERAGWRESVQIVDLENNMPCHKGVVPGEFFFGVDQELFAATAFTGQIGGAATGGTKVAEAIENLLFSADETVDTQRAISKLDAARVLLRHKNGKGGRLFELENECASLEARLEKALADTKERQTKEAHLVDLRRNEKNAREKAALFSKKIKQYETATIVKLFDRMHALEKKVDRLKAEIENSGAPDLELVKRLRTSVERITVLSRELEELQERSKAIHEPETTSELEEYEARGGREGIESEIHGHRMTAKVHTTVGVIVLIVGLIILAIGILPLILRSDLSLWAIIGGAVILAVSLTLFMSGARSRREAKRVENEFDIDGLDELITERRAARDSKRINEFAIDDARRRLEEARREAVESFPKIEDIDNDRLSELLNTLTESCQAAESVKAEYEKHCGILDNMREQLSGYDEQSIRASIDPEADIGEVDRDSFSAMKREEEFAAKSAALLSDRALELERTLARTPLGENPSVLSDRLEAAKAEKETLERKFKAYMLACEKLAEASDALRVSVSPRLAADAAKLMSVVTGGKYGTIGVGSTLEMTTLTESGTRSIQQLSAGTKDAAYLCLRLALVGMLYRKNTPPIIFDESFARIDDERLLKLLTITAAAEQSLILTSNDRDSRLMRGVARFNEIRF